MVGDDHTSDNYYVFLVPDEGYSDICLLHDRLYTGLFSRHHKYEIPYIPHLRIGTASTALQAKVLCDELNAQSVQVDGCLEGVTVCERGGECVVDLESVWFDG